MSFNRIMRAVMGIIFPILLTGCGQSPTVEQTLMVDLTDPHHTPQVSAKAIVDGFGLTTNPWNGAIFRLETLTEMDYNSGTEFIAIKSATPWLNSKPEREVAVQTFLEAVENSIHNLHQENIQRPQSSIFAPLARELTELANSKSTIRRLIVHSDLHEHHEAFSLYRESGLKLLKERPDSVLELLENRSPLPDSLDGVEVYLIWSPASIEESKRFSEMAKWYERILAEKGASVVVDGKLHLPLYAEKNYSQATPKVLMAGMTGQSDCRDIAEFFKELLNDRETMSNLLKAGIILLMIGLLMNGLMYLLDRTTKRYEVYLANLLRKHIREFFEKEDRP